MSEYLFQGMDAYDTPEHHPVSRGFRLMCRSRWYFYFHNFGIFIRSGRLAARGLLDKESQIRLSSENIRLIENCGTRIHLRGLHHLRDLQGRPAVIVDYDRWAFTYGAGNVRVTIDMNVRTAPYKSDIFDPGLLTVPVLDQGEAVLEVKYDAFLPAPARALIEGVRKQRCAVSKYTKCLSILE